MDSSSLSTSFLSLGSNLSGPWGTPRATLQQAVMLLGNCGVTVSKVSNVYKTPPFGPGNQPPFLNAAVAIETAKPPLALLIALKRLEYAAGRRGGRRWGPRTLDIDIVDYKRRNVRLLGKSLGMKPMWLDLPHLGVAERAFVLRPLADIAPDWRHPVTRAPIAGLLARLARDNAKIVDLGPLFSEPAAPVGG